MRISDWSSDVCSSDLLEALSPPADADTSAYHFALPKYFVQLGGLEFVPRAVDGAIPMLIHMPYVPVLALGGELALTLWAGISGWAGILLVRSDARRVGKECFRTVSSRCNAYH